VSRSRPFYATYAAALDLGDQSTPRGAGVFRAHGNVHTSVFAMPAGRGQPSARKCQNRPFFLSDDLDYDADRVVSGPGSLVAGRENAVVS
jgi:hypothetical protein